MKTFALLGFFLLIGCAQIIVGMDLDKPKADQIVRDKTTKEEITKIFGPPVEKEIEAGMERWIYVNRVTSASPKLAWIGLSYQGDVKEKRLVIVFDHDLVKDTSFSEEVKPFVSTVRIN